MSQPKAIDLFSGCGGLTLGLVMAGFDVIGAVEIDPLAVETYTANHKNVHVWLKDISKLSIAEIKKELKVKRGELDLVAGCPPCQGFSTMTTLNGKRGFNDPRNDLVFQFLRIVRGLRPKAVMMENVPGLAKNERIRKVIAALEKMGYTCNPDVLDAADYGVPQRRRRFILLAGLGKKIPFGKTTRKRTVRDAFSLLDGMAAADLLHNLPEKHTEKVMKRIRAIPKNGGSRLALGAENQLPCHSLGRCSGFKDVYGRMAWDEVAPTITGGCFNPSKGRFLHPTKNRAITMREAALLQSFPPDYFFSTKHGKLSVAQMIGNALPPEFIRRHALAVSNYLSNLEKNKPRKVIKNES